MKGIDLPAGYTARPATRADAAAVTDLLNADAQRTMGATPHSLDECYQEWATPNFDLAGSSCMVFAPDGRLAAYAELWDTSEVPTLPFIVGATHPDFWQQGLGRALLDWAAGLAGRALQKVPPEYRVAVCASAPGGHQLAGRLLAEAGFVPIRTFWTMRVDLQAPVPPAVWPEKIQVQTLKEYGDPWRMYLAVREAFEDHFGHVARSAQERKKELDHLMADPSFDPSLWFVALDGRQIAGVSLCHPHADEDRTIGYVDKLGVRRPYRRRGIGLALLRHAFAVFAGRPGYRAVQLNVDTGSATNAPRLYEKAGMAVLRESRLFEKLLRDGRPLENR